MNRRWQVLRGSGGAFPAIGAAALYVLDFRKVGR